MCQRMQSPVFSLKVTEELTNLTLQCVTNMYMVELKLS